jgi:Mg2+-importing ATPase
MSLNVKEEKAMQKSLLTQEKSGDRQKTTPPVQAAASAVSLDALYQQLHSSPGGLTAEEVHKRLRESGPNEPTVGRHGATIQQLLVFLANPLVLILLVASIITAILGEVLNASIIVLMVFY